MRRVRRLLLMAGVTAAVLAGRSLVARRRAVEAVPADLRSPALWFPFGVTSDRSLAVARRLIARMPAVPPTDDVHVAERSIDRRDGGQLRLLVFDPAGRTRPSGAVLWIHGGGLIMGRPEQSADLCRYLAVELDVLVVATSYRLAPDHAFPAGLDDCVDALRWLHDTAADLGVDPDRVAVGGDSAGGGLAAAVAQRAHDESIPLCFQALMYPMLDDRTAVRTDHGGRGRFVWTPQSNHYAWTCYLGRAPGGEDVDPHVAPARRRDLTGLAPAWIGVGELDLFHDEDIDYARRLQAAGVPCQLHAMAGAYHAAERFAPNAAASVAFVADLRDALAIALAPR